MISFVKMILINFNNPTLDPKPHLSPYSKLVHVIYCRCNIGMPVELLKPLNRYLIAADSCERMPGNVHCKFYRKL